jgi:hypothetical protein
MASWVDRYIQPMPSSEQLDVVREPVPDTTCPACGSDDVRRYPVATHQAARMATKCQACLHILVIERPSAGDRWPAFRSVTYDWEASPAERASRELLEREMDERGGPG